MNNHREHVTASTAAERAKILLRRVGLARSRDLEQVGISRTELRRLCERGEIERVGRGLYRNPGDTRTERADLAEASRAVPAGVVCLLSALRFHGLTTQNPGEVWLAIDQKAWRSRTSHPPLRFVFMSGSALHEGVERHMVDGVRIAVFSAAKTVADCFKFRNRIGTDVAVEALREYRRVHPKQLDPLWQMAQVDRVTRVLRPYLEALS